MFLAILLSLSVLPSSDGVRDRLDSLEGPDAGQRLRAQRWLAVNLGPGDYPTVASAAAAGGPETARRLAQALGSDDRHLELASLLATDEDPGIARLGERAVVEQLLRWSSSAMDPPSRKRRLPGDWMEDWPRPLSLDAELGGLAQVIERLDRLGNGPAPLVLDPALDPALRIFVPDREPAQDRLEGIWCRVLLDLARSHKISFEVHGLREEGDAGGEDARVWVRICKRETEGGASGAELLVAWVRASLREHDTPGTAAACRALASSGWPAALSWMGTRWARDGDEAALEGLLLAAAQGRVVQELVTTEGVRALLRRADQSPVEHGPRVARALAGLGALSIKGEALPPLLLEGWDGLDPTRRWIRLVALEGMGTRSRAVAERCSELLASAAPAWVRRQALRTHASVGGTAPILAGPSALLELARDDVAAGVLAQELVAVGARPSMGWGAPPEVPHLTWALWALGSGEAVAAREELGRLLGASTDVLNLAGRLRRWVAFGAEPNLQLVFAGPAPAAAPAGAWRRLLLLTGSAPEGGLAVAVDSLLAEEPRGAGTLLELGAVAGAAGGAGTIFEITNEDAAVEDPSAQPEYFGRMEALAKESGATIMFGVGSSRHAPESWRPWMGMIDRVSDGGGRMFAQVHSRQFNIVLNFEGQLPFDGLPEWKALRARPRAEQIAALRDPETRAKLVHEAHHGEYGNAVGAEARKPDYDWVLVMGDPLGPHERVSDLAKARGVDPVELMIDLALETDFAQNFLQPFANEVEEQVLALMKHPRSLVTFSDAGAHVSQISDCSIATHLLGYWVRQEQAVGLEEAVSMLTAQPAAAFGFSDRGRIAEGFVADLAIFDPATVAPAVPRIEYDLPGGARRLVQEATGFLATIVGGEVLLREGRHSGALPGRVLRRSAH